MSGLLNRLPNLARQNVFIERRDSQSTDEDIWLPASTRKGVDVRVRSCVAVGK
jgi:hypothetical protein